MGGGGVPAAGSTDLSNDDHQEIVPDTTAPVLSGDDDNVMTKADLLGDLLRLIKGSQDPPIHMLNVYKKICSKQSLEMFVQSIERLTNTNFNINKKL